MILTKTSEEIVAEKAELIAEESKKCFCKNSAWLAVSFDDCNWFFDPVINSV